MGGRVARVERQARNQALFRQVNERIAEVSARFEPTDAGLQQFVCECSQLGCTGMIEVPLDVYGRVRGDATLFLVLRGHEDPGHELVVEDLGEVLIVCTVLGVATEVAIEPA
jgi:hypothetical protein